MRSMVMGAASAAVMTCAGLVDGVDRAEAAEIYVNNVSLSGSFAPLFSANNVFAAPNGGSFTLSAQGTTDNPAVHGTASFDFDGLTKFSGQLQFFLLDPKFQSDDPKLLNNSVTLNLSTDDWYIYQTFYVSEQVAMDATSTGILELNSSNSILGSGLIDTFHDGIYIEKYSINTQNYSLSATLPVSEVPLPSTAPLFCAALLALGGIAYRRRQVLTATAR